MIRCDFVACIHLYYHQLANYIFLFSSFSLTLEMGFEFCTTKERTITDTDNGNGRIWNRQCDDCFGREEKTGSDGACNMQYMYGGSIKSDLKLLIALSTSSLSLSLFSFQNRIFTVHRKLHSAFIHRSFFDSFSIHFVEFQSKPYSSKPIS